MKIILIKFENVEPKYNLSRTKINNKKFRDLILLSLKILRIFKFPKEWILKKFISKQVVFIQKITTTNPQSFKNISKNDSEILRKRLSI